MHTTLHEDQDEPKDDPASTKNARMFAVGEVVWGAVRGNPAWPGKVEALNNNNNAVPIASGEQQPASSGGASVWIRWYGSQREAGLCQVPVKSLKSLSEGLEAHHRAQKKFRKGRKLNIPLENAIQEAVSELDSKTRRALPSLVRTIPSRPKERLIAPAPASHIPPQHQPQTRTIGLRKTPGRKVPQVPLALAAVVAARHRGIS